jgi:hypothetical protein
VDKIISAEIPPMDGPSGQKLRDTILKNLIYRPCGIFNLGSPYIGDINREHIYTKKYPRKLQEETVIDSNSYPLYRRTAATTAKIPNPARPSEKITIGNEWVIPYNPLLT